MFRLTFAESRKATAKVANNLRPNRRQFFGLFSGVALSAYAKLLRQEGANQMTASGGFFIQSRFGSKGNFELVAPRFRGQLLVLTRDNDKSTLLWSQDGIFGTGDFTGASLVQSNFGSGPGNFEVVAIQGNQLHHFWRADTLPFAWSGSTTIGSGVTGGPSMIQGTFGSRGNLELVAPLATGGLGH